jgi:hypothetical protein
MRTAAGPASALQRLAEKALAVILDIRRDALAANNYRPGGSGDKVSRVEFVDENGGGAGVRLKKATQPNRGK